MEKLFDNSQPPGTDVVSSVTLEAARAEHQSFQLAVRPDQELTNVSVSVSMVGDTGGITFGLSKPSSLKVRFLPVSQYLLEPAPGVWVLEYGVLNSPGA